MIGHLAAWLVTYAIHSTVLLLVALVAMRLLRSAALRDAVCRVALVGALITATAQQLIPREQRVEVGTIDIAPSEAPRQFVIEGDPAPIAAHEATGVTIPVPRTNPLDYLPHAVVSLWLLGGILLLGRLFVRRQRLLESFGSRREAVSGDDLVMLNLLRERAGLTAPIRLTTSDDLTSPLAMQTAEISVPREMFAALSADQKETILAHELAHLIRRDPLWLMLSEGFKALFFFQPLTRLLQKQMRANAEFLCDDFALLHTGKPKALAETLAELATRIRDEQTLPVAAMAESSSRLIERVTRVLHLDRVPERSLSTAARAALALFVAALGATMVPGVSANVIASPELEGALSRVDAAVNGEGSATPATSPRTAAPAKAPLNTAKPRRSSNAAAATTPQSDVTVNATLESESIFDVGTLSQDDGLARTRLDGRHVALFSDGSSIRFTRNDGYLNVTQERIGGERHDLRVRPNGSRGISYAHTVDGVAREWDEESEAIVADAFRRRSHLMRETAKYRRNPPAPTKGGDGWSGVQEINGTSNGIDFSYRISGSKVRFEGNEVVDIYDGGGVRISDEVEGRRRSAEISGSRTNIEITYRGDWSDSCEEERAAWLAHYLSARSGANVGPFLWDKAAKKQIR